MTRPLTLANVPRRMDCRVVIPNQISIWFNHEDPTGVKGKWTCGFFASHAFTSGVACVERFEAEANPWWGGHLSWAPDELGPRP